MRNARKEWVSAGKIIIHHARGKSALCTNMLYIEIYISATFWDSGIFTLANEIDGKSIEIVYKYISSYKNAFVEFLGHLELSLPPASQQ